MTLELSPELEREIEAAARLRGLDAPSFVRDAARRALDPFAALEGDALPLQGILTPEAEAAQKRREAAAAGFGMFAGHGLSVDEFLDARHAEAQRDAGNFEATA